MKDRWSGSVRYVFESSFGAIAIQDARLLVVRSKLVFVDFWIDVAVHQQQIRPAIVVEVHEHRAPSEVLGMQTEAGRIGSISESAIAVVAIERGAVVREIGFENVELSIAIEVGDGGPHAGLFTSVFIECRACYDCDVGKSAIVIIAIENAGRAVTRDVNVGPAIVIEVDG